MVDTCIFIVRKNSSIENPEFEYVNLKNENVLQQNEFKNFSKPNWEILLDYIFGNINKYNIKLVDHELFRKNLNFVFFNPVKRI